MRLVLASAHNLGPIQRALQKQIVASEVIQLDDTPVQCQNGKGASLTRAYLWTYASPLVNGIVFDFTPDWEHHHVATFLGPDAKGYLVGDGYKGYGTIVAENPKLIEAGCFDHVFRKFKDALKESPVEALRMLGLIGKLFEIESAADAQNLSAEERHALREKESKPQLAKIKATFQPMRKDASLSEAGKLAAALKYIDDQWPTLERFLENGNVPIHNNTCENAIRPVAVGRRNWLFAGSERGGQAAATVYTLIESCPRAQVDPFRYLKDILVRVCTHPANRVDGLIPANWKLAFGPGEAN